MHNNNWQGRKVKNLADTANKCFGEIVGNPPNDVHSYNSVKDIVFIINSLNAMVENYLVYKVGKQEQEVTPAEFLPPIIVENEADIEKVVSAIGEALKDKTNLCRAGCGSGSEE